VKSSAAVHHRGFAVRASWRTSHRQISYKPSQADFMAVTIVGKGIWYVIPVRALAGRLTINLYPFGSRRGSRNGFEKYRGAWHLLGGKGPLHRKRATKIRSRIRPTAREGWVRVPGIRCSQDWFTGHGFFAGLCPAESPFDCAQGRLGVAVPTCHCLCDCYRVVWKRVLHRLRQNEALPNPL